MTAAQYNLRSKLNVQGVSLKTTPALSPFAKQGPRSPQKPNGSVSSLDLRTIIGTTTEGQTGFASHPESDTFAFCAGSTVVLGKVDETGHVSHRFFRAHPTSGAVNPFFSFYDETTASGTPENRRKTTLSTKSGGFSVTSTGSPRREWSDDNISKPWTAKDRVKATSSVSLTADGRFLAVGETGYCPRVLIFSTDKDSIDIPLSIIPEHSFGVRAVAFSPDSRFLATLGDANDGFLFIWSFDSRTGGVKLHSTNKCTANICGMAWCGDSLITVGTRHVKIWRIQERLRKSPTRPRGRRPEGESLVSPSPQALLGRNCVLGSLADATFTCVAALSNNEAIVCTNRGQVCTVSGTENAQEIKASKQLGFGIYSIATKLNSAKVLFGGTNGTVEKEDLETLQSLARPARRPPSGPQSPAPYAASLKPFSPYGSPSRSVRRRHHSVTALGWLSNSVISVDSKYSINVLSDRDNEEFASVKAFQSHHDPIQGLNLLPGKSDIGAFFTWSPTGKLHFWDAEGKLQASKLIGVESVPGEVDDDLNELRVVKAFERAEYFACGDKFGVLKIIRTKDWSVLHEMRAHGAELNDIAIHDQLDMRLIASCGRDRMVQLFAMKSGSAKNAGADDLDPSSPEASSIKAGRHNVTGSLELVQSMDDHVGVVGHVLFTNESERLLSSSADRTVVVRDRVTRQSGMTTSVAYINIRVITLKSSPTSMATVFGDKDSLVVSTMDRQILRLNLSSGTHVESFKVSDGEGDENVVMNFVQVSKGKSPRGSRLLLGSCSSDKSIRVYDYDQGTLIARESSHTEGISGLLLTEEEDAESGETRRTVISSGLDGTIMIWDLKIQLPQPPSTPLQELSQGQVFQTYDSSGTPSKAPVALRPPLRKVLSKSDLADFSFFDPLTKSLTPVRDQSPPRVRKKTSRYSLAPNKLGLADSPSLPPAKRSTTEGDGCCQSGPPRNRSPSPLPAPRPSQGIKQHTPTNHARQPTQNSNRGDIKHSPSPPPPMPKSMPSTPSSKTGQRANNARLRRPPSIPSDLHTTASTPRGRRKSLTPTTTNTTDPTATSASQNLSRNLRSYRKKISAMAAEQAKEQVQLEEVETELLATLQSVREAKKANAKIRAGSSGGGSWRRRKAKAATDPDLNSLAKLMEKTGFS
jgi:WD40 repeat protein